MSKKTLILIIIGLIFVIGSGFYFYLNRDGFVIKESNNSNGVQGLNGRTSVNENLMNTKTIIYRESEYKKIEGKEYPTEGDYIGSKDIEVLFNEGDNFDYRVSFKTELDENMRTNIGYIGSNRYDFNLDPEKEIEFVYSDGTAYCEIENTVLNFQDIPCVKSGTFYHDIDDLQIYPVNTQYRASYLKIRGHVSEIKDGKIAVKVEQVILYTQ